MKKILLFLMVVFSLLVVSACNDETTATETPEDKTTVVEQHNHTYSTEWSKDETHHWHAASCEHTDLVSDKAEHTWDEGVVTLEPTVEEQGEKTYTCTVCSKTKVDTLDRVEPQKTELQSLLEEASALESGQALEGDRTITGTISEIIEAYSTQYKNITFILTDGTTSIKVYRAKGECAEYLKVGDEVTVTGKVKNFYGSVEFEFPKLTSDVGPEKPEEVEVSTVKEVLDAAASLAAGEQLQGEYTVYGTISGFAKKTSGGSSYYIFYITDDSGATIYIYKPQGDIVSDLADGDKIYVTGVVKNYKGTIEFDCPEAAFSVDPNATFVDLLTEKEKTPIIPEEVTGDYEFISLPMAIAIARDGGEDFVSTTKYYITGWVSNVSNYSYGSLTITDGNVSIFAYGIANYLDEETWPLLGDVVVLEAVVGTKGTDVELKNATRIVEWHDVVVDQTEYENGSIEDARNAEAGEKVIVSGVVAGFTYKNAKTRDGGYVRDGLYLVNNTDSIYVYGVDLCSAVEIGNTITVAATKEYFIQESEISLATKFNFTGACQLSQAYLISNAGGNTSILENGFEETTIKDLMSNKYDNNVTTQIYQVNAVIKKAPGAGFVNYYIDDLDGKTGSYTYTKCNGADFAWLDSYLNEDGEYLCTLLVTLCNAKATASGCVWRFIPVAIIDSFEFDLADTNDYVLDYHVLTQFEREYYADPQLELVTTVSSTLLGFEGATISYSSSDESIATVTTTEGKTVLNILQVGEVDLTVSITYNGTTTEHVVKVVRRSEPTFESLTVNEAINARIDSYVVVEGIVGPSLVNQTGFYLIDESGVIAIRTTSDVMSKVALGNRVVITGQRAQFKSSATVAGQTCVLDAELTHNYYGTHDYSVASFEESTLAALAEMPVSENHTSQVYIIEATVYSKDNTHYIKCGEKSIGIYCSGAGQNAWLESIADGQTTVKLEVALCNWNEKNSYKVCILAFYNADETKVVNALNFSK